MDARSKAEELVDRYQYWANPGKTDSHITRRHNAKLSATYYCNGVLEILETLAKPEYVAFVAKNKFHLDETEYDTHLQGYELKDYFESVKSEIEKL